MYNLDTGLILPARCIGTPGWLIEFMFLEKEVLARYTSNYGMGGLKLLRL